MTEIIRVTKFNDVHIKLHCDSGVAQEIGEYFTFSVPGAKFSPAYKNKMWDGKIRLFHLMRQTLYMGLLDSVHKFAKERGYEIEYDNPNDFAETEFSVTEAETFIKTLNLPHQILDYQLEAFIHAVRKRYGFVFFDDVIDHSYDLELNHHERLIKFVKEIKREIKLLIYKNIK